MHRAQQEPRLSTLSRRVIVRAPRELRNLAMPDREWKVEMPIVGTVAPPLTMPTASPKAAARAASAGAASGGEERASTPLVAEEDEMPL